MKTDKQAASKLRERVDDWQSYLGRADNPWNPSGESSNSPNLDEKSTQSHFSPVSQPAPDRVATEAVAEAAAQPSTPVVEVLPPPAAKPVNPARDSRAASPQIIEVLPPEDSPRRQSSRVNGQSEWRRVSPRNNRMFPDQRRAEADYDHARKANAILSSFVVVLLGVLFTIMAMMLVD